MINLLKYISLFNFSYHGISIRSGLSSYQFKYLRFVILKKELWRLLFKFLLKNLAFLL